MNSQKQERVNWKLIRIAVLVSGSTDKILEPEIADEITGLLKGIQSDLSIGKIKIQRLRRWFNAYHTETGYLTESRSQSEFARLHNLNQRSISACLRGKNTIHKGWTFKWL